MDRDVDDRFGRDARNRCAADVLNVGRPLANGSVEAGPLFFEELGPAGGVVGEVDRV